MGDFAQSGDICTLPWMGTTTEEELELELGVAARERPIALILPCHARDLRGPGLRQLRAELAEASWLSEVVFTLNGLREEDESFAREFFIDLPQHVRVLWNDSPLLTPHYQRLLKGRAWSMGKGFNVWAGIGLLLATTRPAVFALLDCDVTSFRRGSLARLCAPCVSGSLSGHFSKLYYPRVSDRLYGRVSRLFLAPLLQALGQVTPGDPLLAFLSAFRYPLAGETALRRAWAEQIAFPCGWGLEVAMLCAVQQRGLTEQVYQVEGDDTYDHYHQPAATGLLQMCRAIAQTLRTYLAGAQGSTASLDDPRVTSHLETILEQTIRRSRAVASFNQLPYDADAERVLARSFHSVLPESAPFAEPILPPWEQQMREVPAEVAAWVQAVSDTSRGVLLAKE